MRHLNLNKIVIRVFAVELLCENSQRQELTTCSRERTKDWSAVEATNLKLSIENIFAGIINVDFSFRVSVICIEAMTRLANYRMIVEFIPREIKKKKPTKIADIFSACLWPQEGGEIGKQRRTVPGHEIRVEKADS